MRSLSLCLLSAYPSWPGRPVSGSKAAGIRHRHRSSRGDSWTISVAHATVGHTTCVCLLHIGGSSPGRKLGYVGRLIPHRLPRKGIGLWWYAPATELASTLSSPILWSTDPEDVTSISGAMRGNRVGAHACIIIFGTFPRCSTVFLLRFGRDRLRHLWLFGPRFRWEFNRMGDVLHWLRSLTTLQTIIAHVRRLS